MFVQSTKSSRGKKTYLSYLVRESFRTPAGPRSRTLCNITALPAHVRELIASALKGRSLVAVDQLRLEKALSYGGLAVLVDAWERFGLAAVLENIPKARDRRLSYGHSRDHRADRPQIILAVATDAEGTPIHLSVLRGNRADNKTLVGLLRTLRRRFGVQEAMFVFDGGMSSRLNLAELTDAKMEYVTRLSNATFAALWERLSVEQQAELGDHQNLLELEHDSKRYVMAGGPWRQQRDLERRQSRVGKAETELKRLAAVVRKKVNAQKLASQVGRMLVRKQAHKYFTYRVDEQGQLQWERKADVITAEERLDGWYLLHTNAAAANVGKEQVLGHYKGLLEIEDAFCQLKSYLEVRPIFHWRPDRVRNHVRICFLAYWLSARLGREWRVRQEVGEVPRILRELQNIRVGTVRAASQPIATLLTEIPPALNAQLSKLNLLKLFAQPPAWAQL